jgi:putative addiction module killer protein
MPHFFKIYKPHTRLIALLIFALDSLLRISYTVVVYEIEQSETFVKWFRDLKDIRAKARIKARIERVAKGNFGDWSPEGGEIRAMRIDYGPGYRLYYTIRGNKVVILLCGGDKRTQEADIRKANTILEEDI